MISVYLCKLSDYLEDAQHLEDVQHLGTHHDMREDQIVSVLDKETKESFRIFASKIDPDNHFLLIKSVSYHIWSITKKDS